MPAKFTDVFQFCEPLDRRNRGEQAGWPLHAETTVRTGWSEPEDGGERDGKGERRWASIVAKRRNASL